MRLIGYVRVSTEEQARDGLSLGQQPDRLAAYCSLHAHELLQVITDEGVSASLPLDRRPGGKQVLQALEQGDADGVVVVRLDRLFRDAFDGLSFFRRAEKARVAVHSVSELIDTSTPAGRLALTIQLAAAQYERDLAVQRATECNAALREQGRVYGPVPYGCVAVGEGTERRLMREPLAWCRRQWILRKLTGERLSLRVVAQMLAERCIPSPTGKRRWSLNTLRELRVHHDSLRGLPLATGDYVATAPNRSPDPRISVDA